MIHRDYPVVCLWIREGGERASVKVRETENGAGRGETVNKRLNPIPRRQQGRRARTRRTRQRRDFSKAGEGKGRREELKIYEGNKGR